MAVKFDDLISALQGAVVEARKATERQHMELLRRWFVPVEPGSRKNPNIKELRPRRVRVRVPSLNPNDPPGTMQALDVPLLTLVPISTIQIQEIEIEFKTQLSSLESENEESGDGESGKKPRKISKLMVDLKKPGMFSSGTEAHVKVTFSTVDTPEGVVRINDQIVKTLP